MKHLRTLSTILLLIVLAITAPVWANDAPLTPEAHQRGGDQTFLTFPEWYLVHSPVEYAKYVATHTPTRFPFLGHTKQLWQSYGAVYDEVKDRFPFNNEYHTMIMVIGVSTTVEYGLKSAYETLIGRLSELLASGELTPEDELGAVVAQEYVDFIFTTPWYEFNYWGAFKRLWGDTPFFGPHMIRKLERKYLLSTEYLVKAGYAWLIKRGTKATFDAPAPVTAAVLSGLSYGVTKLPTQAIAGSNSLSLVMMPRYQPFTDHAAALAANGVRFEEIAGNQEDVLVSVLAPVNWLPQRVTHRVLFTQAILTQPGQQRLALVVPIEELHTLLNLITVADATLEHVYDF